MQLRIRPFARGDFAEYQNWFSDRQLRQSLEGVDEQWLDHVLNDPSGQQFIANDIADQTMVACIGVCFAVHDHPMHVITDIAIKPDRRGQGIGRATVGLVIDEIEQGMSIAWGAYVAPENVGAQRFFAALGWKADHDPSDDMVLFVR